MQPLGLGAGELRDYHDHILRSHRFRVELDILDLEENLLSQVEFTDGQVDIQRKTPIRRTMTVTIPDGPEVRGDLHPVSARFAQRMFRARHIVDVPTVGEVEATFFVGPVVRPRLEADGQWTFEAQDKARIALTGSRTVTARKGSSVAGAIRKIMRQATGETRFRVQAGTNQRTARSYSCGWTDQAAPWLVCQRIARDHDIEVFYAADGALVIRRRRPRRPRIALPLSAITSAEELEIDLSESVNYVRVKGGTLPRKGSRNRVVTAVAEPPRRHSLNAHQLARHDVPWFWPMVVEESDRFTGRGNGGGVKRGAWAIRQKRQARRRAANLLEDNLPVEMSTRIAGIPIFHLDDPDIVRFRTDRGDVRMRLEAGASLPMADFDDASYGVVRTVMRTPRVRSAVWIQKGWR